MHTPDAVAVVFGSQTRTYSQLDEQASTLARRLISLGVGPDCLVSVAHERSLEMIVSLLAVLKAGGAFAPFDTNYPSERLDFMFADSRPKWCLTHGSLIDALPIRHAAIVWRGRDGSIIAVDRKEASPLAGDVGPPPFRRAGRRLTRRSLAYAIYTSGSTGRPKAVLLTQIGLANLIAAQRQLLRLRPGCRVLQFASLSFDAAVWEIFGALVHLGLGRPRSNVCPIATTRGAATCSRERRRNIRPPRVRRVLGERRGRLPL